MDVFDYVYGMVRLYGQVDLNMVMRIGHVTSHKDQRELIEAIVESMPDFHFDGQILWEPDIYQHRAAIGVMSEQLQPHPFSDKEIIDGRDDRKSEKASKASVNQWLKAHGVASTASIMRDLHSWLAWDNSHQLLVLCEESKRSKKSISLDEICKVAAASLEGPFENSFIWQDILDRCDAATEPQDNLPDLLPLLYAWKADMRQPELRGHTMQEVIDEINHRKAFAQETDPTVRLLNRYMRAMANLYGLISVDEAYAIIAGQQPQIGRKQFDAFCTKFADPEGLAFIQKGMILGPKEAASTEQYQTLQQRHQGKTHYVPDAELLLQYEQPDFSEETPQRAAVVQWLKAKTKLTAPKVEILMRKAAYQIRHESVDAAIETLIDDGAKCTDIDQMNELLQLITDWANHTRLKDNRGHTPAELYRPEKPRAISFGPGFQQLVEEGKLDPTELAQFLEKQGIRTEGLSKVGRNDLCPCGSGKKYKKCCGRTN